MVRLRSALFAFLLLPSICFAQAQLPSGYFWGNPNASKAPAQPGSVTQMFDRALGNTRGAIPERGASGWGLLGPGTAGKPFIWGGAGADPSTGATLDIVGGGTNCAVASGTCLDNITGFASTGIIQRTGAGTYAFITACASVGGACLDAIANFSSTGYIKRTGAGAYSFILPIPVADGGTNCSSASGTCLDNITGFSSTGVLLRTGAGAYSFVALGTNVQTALGTATGSVNGFPLIIANGTAALGTSAISSGACATVVTVTATGAATTDVIDAGFNADPTAITGYTAPNMLTIIPYPTTNNANFKVCNNTSGSITPGAVTLNWRIRR